MEPVASMSEGDWSSFSGMCFTEEANFMAQLLGNCSFPNDSNNYGVSSGYWNIGHESNIGSSGGREHSGFLFPPPSHESYSSNSRPILMRNDSSITTERGLMDTNNPIKADEYFVNNQDNVSKDNMEFDENMPEPLLDGKRLQLGRIDYERFPEDKMDHSPTESSKKRARLHVHVPKNKRSTKLQTDVKIGDMDGKNKAVLQRQNSMISCCSEDESNVSLELTQKSRASSGSATDPQSLYARKRRERINERLKTLQSLIPNGTKVDISTMLEEAVQYVKFLQLQIKLLSSDDLWMYAPIAYNGMDLGLDLRIALPK